MLSVEFLAQILADGLVTGSVYVLVAIGLTLIFGVLGIVNFAHGEFYMLGGYFGITAAALLKLGMLESLGIAIVAIALVAFLAEQLVFRPLSGRDLTSTIIVSFGLSVLLQNLALLMFGPEPTGLDEATLARAPGFTELQKDLRDVMQALIEVAGASRGRSLAAE